MNSHYLAAKGAGAILNPPASATLIETTEKRLGVIFPEPLRQFYLLANGFSQDSIWNFFPLAEFTTHTEYRTVDLRTIEGHSGKMPNPQTLIFIADAMRSSLQSFLFLKVEDVNLIAKINCIVRQGLDIKKA